MSLCFRPLLPVEVGSSAATCPMASGSTFSRGELRCYHVSHAPNGLWTIGIKKDLAVLGTQLGSRVTKVLSHVTDALEDVRTCDIIITKNHS
jgi:hypothetical protein